MSEKEKWEPFCESPDGFEAHQSPNFIGMKNSRKGRTLFLTGSGPSLLKEDLSLLRGLDVMCINHTIFPVSKECRPTFWTFIDALQLFGDYIPKAVQGGAMVIYSWHIQNFARGENIVRVNPCALPGHCGFATVDFSLGIAGILGYQTVNMIGFDEGGGHITDQTPKLLAADSYQWTRPMVKNHAHLFSRLRVAGRSPGHPYLPRVPLQQAVAEAFG